MGRAPQAITDCPIRRRTRPWWRRTRAGSSAPSTWLAHGYVSYLLDLTHRPVDWAEVTELLRDSYRLQAPKRLVRLLDD